MKNYSLNIVLSILFLVSLCVSFIGWVSYIVFQENAVHIYAENSLIENMQAYFLAIASSVYLVIAIFEHRSDKLIIVFCTVLCLGFLLRELDVERFDVPYALILIGSGTGRNLILATAVLVILGCATLRFSHYKMVSACFLKSRPGQLLITGGVFLLVGQFFENNHSITHHVFLEEIHELFGYFLILLSSILSGSVIGDSISGCTNKSIPSA